MLKKQNYIETKILEIAILEMCRLKKDESFTVVDVVQWIYPQHWIHFISEAEEAMMELHRSGKIIVLDNDINIVPELKPKVSYRIKAIVKTS